MYRNCIFCAADLKGNDALERFPVGRSVAFDEEKGRLWAVCPRCARWNLAPIEERWEAIEDAERLFHDARNRVQHENIGLARLRDGTRLVRVGDARLRELVAWRYGRTFTQRRRRANGLAATGFALAMGAGLPAVAGLVLPAIALFGAGTATLMTWGAMVQDDLPAGAWSSRILHQARGPHRLEPLRARQLVRARLRTDDTGHEIELEVPREADGLRLVGGRGPLVLRGQDAVAALGRGLVLVNRRGADRDAVWRAQRAIERAGSPHALLMKVARRTPLVTGAQVTPEERYAPTDDRSPAPHTTMSLEMALHQEQERRALEGELSALQEMWRQAEAIAAIADRLPGLPGRWGSRG